MIGELWATSWGDFIRFQEVCTWRQRGGGWRAEIILETLGYFFSLLPQLKQSLASIIIRILGGSFTCLDQWWPSLQLEMLHRCTHTAIAELISTHRRAKPDNMLVLLPSPYRTWPGITSLKDCIVAKLDALFPGPFEWILERLMQNWGRWAMRGALDGSVIILC